MRASGSVYLLYWYKSTNTDTEGAAGAVCARVAQNFGRLEHSTSDPRPGGSTSTKVLALLVPKYLLYIRILEDLNTAPAIRDLEVRARFTSTKVLASLVPKYLLYLKQVRWYQ